MTRYAISNSVTRRFAVVNSAFSELASPEWFSGIRRSSRRVDRRRHQRAVRHWPIVVGSRTECCGIGALRDALILTRSQDLSTIACRYGNRNVTCWRDV